MSGTLKGNRKVPTESVHTFYCPAPTDRNLRMKQSGQISAIIDPITDEAYLSLTDLPLDDLLAILILILMLNFGLQRQTPL